MAGNRWILWFEWINRKISHFSNCQKYSVLQFFVWSHLLNQFQEIHSFVGLVLLDLVLEVNHIPSMILLYHAYLIFNSQCNMDCMVHLPTKLRSPLYGTYHMSHFLFRFKILRTNPKSAFAFSKKRTLYFCGLSFWNSNALKNYDL